MSEQWADRANLVRKAPGERKAILLLAEAGPSGSRRTATCAAIRNRICGSASGRPKYIPTEKQCRTWWCFSGAALRQIAVIFSLEKELTNLSPEERLTRRQNSVKPLVEAYFAWVREHKDEVPTKSETGKGFTYCLNQEPYLKAFLNNGLVPLDNNAAESAIRGFCIGRKNWVLIDTVAGAKVSAIIYSIVETAKANRLKIYEYLEHLLTEILKHMDGHDLAFSGGIAAMVRGSASRLPKEYVIPSRPLGGFFLWEGGWFTGYTKGA